MKKILIIENIHESGIKLLKEKKDFTFEIIDKLDPVFIKKKIDDCDAIVLRTFRLSAELINSAKKLQIISRHGVGYDNVDLDTIKKRNITLAITATTNAVAVVEHVFFMMLNISKGHDMYDKCVKSGEFSKRSQLPRTIELWNKKILIVGFGRIGQNLIKRCLGFEMEVFVYDPFIDENKINSLGGKKVSNINSIIKDMDYVSVHVPLNDKTRNLINLNNMKTMKKTAILINAARGGVINESDLEVALNKNYIFGAGLDVFEKEPPDINNPLLKNKKVFLSPHTASFTEECMQRMSKETIQNIIDFFEKKLDKSMIIKL
ncbi:MAG: hydroxyacid dehydrogenase [Pelagibacteraceae bacterium]|jgi:D-3-phosphoglycerate dehydrogenase|nr:hydroxyacid dehydrogenase [Pelagibacteraceae bacterium]